MIKRAVFSSFLLLVSIPTSLLGKNVVVVEEFDGNSSSVKGGGEAG